MDGLLVIDKPPRVTSHHVVAQARRILGERRIGHTGTLDPFATGVLVLLVGRATRLAQFLASAEKEYDAVIRFGFATDTGDVEGTPLGSAVETNFGNEQLNNALRQLTGEIRQIPPMYSAKKRRGKKLYQLARRGETVEREPVLISVRRFEPVLTSEVLLKSNADGTQDLKVHVICSAGCYVRTLAEDLGKLLGVGAHLAELRRTHAGDFGVAGAISLGQLKQFVNESSLGTILLPMKAALSQMHFVHLSTEDARRARNGMALRTRNDAWAEGENIALCDRDEVIGVARYKKTDELLQPRIVLT
ncbi:MAG TPA: tRNA pseudouridine(55) synthase TruB [Pyrinomonadaceae bacterium]|nr:tRNA pseudouridine(55) synthase TruB [Pyrinomonadaceae bacterium]